MCAVETFEAIVEIAKVRGRESLPAQDGRQSDPAHVQRETKAASAGREKARGGRVSGRRK